MLRTKCEEEIPPVQSPVLFLLHWEGQVALELLAGLEGPHYSSALGEGRQRYKGFKVA